MKLFKILILLSVLLLPSAALCLDVPEGWRLISEQEFNPDNWRSSDKEKFLSVQEDFNGDGIKDLAKILAKKDDSGFGLFVSMSDKEIFKTYLLEENTDLKHLTYTGIRSVSPGIYKTACGKGYWDCKADETPEIQLTDFAIDYFASEGANSFFYFDIKTKKFKRIWISD